MQDSVLEVQVTKAAAEWLAQQHPQPAFFLIDNCETPGAHPLSAWEQVSEDQRACAAWELSSLWKGTTILMRLMGRYRWGRTTFCWR